MFRFYVSSAFLWGHPLKGLSSCVKGFMSVLCVAPCPGSHRGRQAVGPATHQCWRKTSFTASFTQEGQKEVVTLRV